MIVNNKIRVSNSSKWRVAAKYILIICEAVIIVITGFRIFMGDEIHILNELLLPAIILVYGLRMNGRTDGYNSAT